MIIKHERHILRNSQGVHKSAGFLFSRLCSSDADWLARQSLLAWIAV